MMAEFQRVDIEKYLRDRRKAVDRIDRIKDSANSVNSVKSISRESVEKKYQAKGSSATLTLEDVLKISPAAGPVKWMPLDAAKKERVG